MSATELGLNSHVTATEDGVEGFTMVRPASNILCCELRDEAVILNLKTGVYHGLDEVGARIWQIIQETVSIDEICSLLVTEYTVDRERCEQEVTAFIAKLIELDLVQIEK